MEEYSGRRSTTPIGFLRRGSSTSLRNRSHEDRANRYSNRPESITRLNPTKSRLTDNQEKPIYLRDSYQSSSSTAMPASSSKAPLRKSCAVKQRRSLLAEADIAESSNRKADAERLKSRKKVVAKDEKSDTQQTESEDTLSTSTTEGSQLVTPDTEVSDSAASLGISANTVGSLDQNAASNSEPEAYSSSFVHQPTTPRNSTIGAKSSYGLGTGVQRRGIKNMGCTSISDVLPSGCSADSVHNRRAEAIVGKRTYVVGSSSRSRGLSVPSSCSHSSVVYPGVTGPRIRAAEESVSQQTLRRISRNSRDSAVSVRTRRPATCDTRMRMPEERENSMFAQCETVIRAPQQDRAHFCLDEVPLASSTRPFPVELPHAIYSSSPQDSSSQTTRTTSSSRSEESPPRMFHGLLGERDVHRRITMEGIAQVLLVLDWIEQAEDLTYERLLALENNLFLGGFTFHDEHRDMRMDIDNMTYEELLALEERIGSVSTALSEEQFAKCLKRSVYRPVITEANRSIVDDIKCSICQEEYVKGEEVGRLGCEHQYHVCCIHQWLRQKNWCPICKASAIPS